MNRLLKTCAVAVALTVLAVPMSTFAARVEVTAPAAWFARLGSIIELRMLASSWISLKVPGVVWLSSDSGTDDGSSGGTGGGQSSGDDGSTGEGESGFVDR